MSPDRVTFVGWVRIGDLWGLEEMRVTQTGMGRLALLAVFTAVPLGCGSGELGRGEAANLIRESSEFHELCTKVSLQSGGLAKGQMIGLWNSRGVLSEKGAEIATETKRGWVYLKDCIEPSIEVTGIAKAHTPDNAVRRVEFTWRYSDDLPVAIKQIAENGGNGQLLAELYDDGWRTKQVNVKTSNDPMELSKSEKEDLQEAEERAKRAEEERKQRIKLSQTPSRTIRTVPYPAQANLKQLKEGEVMVLTDTNLQLRGFSRYHRGPAYERQAIWFGDISKVTPSSYKRLHFADVHIPLAAQRARRYQTTGTCCVQAVFGTAAERDEFIHELNVALDAWRREYSDIR